MHDPEPALSAIDLTHVQFPHGDFVGMALAYSSLLPIFLIVSYTTALFMRREIAIGIALLGQLINEVVNLMLKQWFSEHRPHVKLGKGYGMPSSHSQFMTWFAMYISLYAWKRLTFKNNSWRWIITFITFGLGTIVAYSRVYLLYHTPKQVMVGYSLGIIFGYCWFVIVEQILRPYVYPIVLSLPISKFVQLRDSAHVGNVFDFEREAYQTLMKKRVR